MGLQISKGTYPGTYKVYSTIIDRYLFLEVDKETLINWYIEYNRDRLKLEVEQAIDRCDKGIKNI